MMRKFLGVHGILFALLARDAACCEDVCVPKKRCRCADGAAVAVAANVCINGGGEASLEYEERNDDLYRPRICAEEDYISHGEDCPEENCGCAPEGEYIEQDCGCGQESGYTEQDCGYIPEDGYIEDGCGCEVYSEGGYIEDGGDCPADTGDYYGDSPEDFECDCVPPARITAEDIRQEYTDRFQEGGEEEGEASRYLRRHRRMVNYIR